MKETTWKLIGEEEQFSWTGEQSYNKRQTNNHLERSGSATQSDPVTYEIPSRLTEPSSVEVQQTRFKVYNEVQERFEWCIRSESSGGLCSAV